MEFSDKDANGKMSMEEIDGLFDMLEDEIEPKNIRRKRDDILCARDYKASTLPGMMGTLMTICEKVDELVLENWERSSPSGYKTFKEVGYYVGCWAVAGVIGAAACGLKELFG